jgi:hypothetical protein
MVSHDDLGTIALRLGRAFNQAWAAGAPKGVPWGWSMASYFARISGSSRKPHVDDEVKTLRHSPRGMDWSLSRDGVSVKFNDRRSNGGELRAAINEARQPYIILRLDDWASMSTAQVARFDVAVTAVSHGPWQCFYSMPPLSIMSTALGGVLPARPVDLAFVLVGAEPTLLVSADVDPSSDLAARVRKLVDAGMLKNWHRMRVAK